MRKRVLIVAGSCLLLAAVTIFVLWAIWFTGIPDSTGLGTAHASHPAARTAYQELCDAIDEGEAKVVIDLAAEKAEVSDGTVVNVERPTTCIMRLKFSHGQITLLDGSFDQLVTIKRRGNPAVQIKSFIVSDQGTDFKDIRLKSAFGPALNWAVRKGMRKLARATVRLDPDLYDILQGHLFLPEMARGDAPPLGPKTRLSSSRNPTRPEPLQSSATPISRAGFASLVRHLEVLQLSATLKEGGTVHIMGSGALPTPDRFVFAHDSHLSIAKARLTLPTPLAAGVQLELSDASLAGARVEFASRLHFGEGSYIDLAPESRFSTANVQFTADGGIQQLTLSGSVRAASGRIALTPGPAAPGNAATFTIGFGSKLEVGPPGITLSRQSPGHYDAVGTFDSATLNFANGELHLGGRSSLALGKGRVIGQNLTFAGGRLGIVGAFRTNAEIRAGTWDFGAASVGIGVGSVKCAVHATGSVDTFVVDDIDLRARLNVSGQASAGVADLAMTNGSVQVRAARFSAAESDLVLQGVGPASLTVSDAYGPNTKPDLFEYDHHGNLTTRVNIAPGWTFSGHIKYEDGRLSGEVQQKGGLTGRVDFDSYNPQYGKGTGKVGNESGDDPYRCIVHSREHGDIPGDVEVWLRNTAGASHHVPNAPAALEVSINGAHIEFGADGIYLVADARLSLGDEYWDFWTEHGLFDGIVRKVVRETVTENVHKMTSGMRFRIGEKPG